MAPIEKVFYLIFFGKNGDIDWLAIQTFIFAITLLGVFWYAWEAFKQRKITGKQTDLFRQANMFSALVTTHERLTNETSYRIRGFIYKEFPEYLRETVKNVFGEQFCTSVSEEKRVNVSKVLKELRRDTVQRENFHERLNSYFTPVKGIRALEAVERILLDFDIIAIPFYMKIEAAKTVAEAYRPVIEAIAKEVLPFIAIQEILRDDPKYKRYFLILLQGLGIDLQGLKVQEDGER